MPEIERYSQQEEIDTVLAQGDQIPIREKNTSDSDLETLASNQSSDELSEETSEDTFEDMADADVQELLRTLIARPPSYMKPKVFAGNEGRYITIWIDQFERIAINNAWDEAKKCRTIPLYCMFL